MSDSPSTVKSAKNPKFPTTQWTVIRRVQQGGEADATAAMEEICRQYWFPVYAFYRRYGFRAMDAEDLAQEFFRACINRNTIQAARKEKGRLRSFMLNMLRDLAANHLRQEATLKRGGGTAIVSLEENEAEALFSREVSKGENPSSLFDRAWAKRLLAAATERLRADFEKGDNLDDYEQLKEYLPLAEASTPYGEAARRLGVSEGTLRLQIHRMRKRWARHIDAEIAETVNDPAERLAEREYLLSLVELGC